MTQKAVAAFLPAPRTLGALMLGTALALGSVFPLHAQETVVQAQVLTPDQTRPLSFAELAEQVSPSVVNITTSMMIAKRTNNPAEGTPFEELFRDFGGQGGRGGEQERATALGSGFVISDDGYVVTNNHVIEGADEIVIEFFSGEKLPAKVVGTDPNTDIALLKVEATGLPHVEFGNSDGTGARVGDWVMAMGNPLGQGFSVSAGIVSARNRELSGSYDDYIQTDAAINRGNSGGPLFNMEGKVIGVNTAILSPNGGSIGIGFAMSSKVVSGVVNQLKEFGETRRGWLGVSIQEITEDMVGAMAGLESKAGALISNVPEGPAQEAGIKAGDVVLTFNGEPVKNSRDLVQRVGQADVGSTVKLGVLRAGETLDIDVTLGRREEAEGQVSGGAGSEEQAVGTLEIMGLRLSDKTPQLEEQMKLAKGPGVVITAIESSSDAAQKMLQPGDVIVEAGQAPVTTVGEFQAQVTAAKEAGRNSILVLVRRGEAPRFVALMLDK